MRFSRRALLGSAAAASLFPLTAKASTVADILSAGDAPAGPPVAATPVARLLADIAEAMLQAYPENASFRGVDTGARAPLKHRLTDRSDEGAQRRAAACAERLTRLKAVERNSLSGEEAIGYDCALIAHQQALDGSKFGYGDDFVLHALWAENIAPYAVTQMTGDFQSVPDFLDSMHAVASSDDADAYLDRLDVYASCLDQETARIANDAAGGVNAPAFVHDTLLGQYKAYLAQPTEQWGLVTSIARRTKEKGLSDAYAAKALAICDNAVRPAIARQNEATKAARLTATPEAGVWKLPQGEAYYDWQIQVNAGRFTADDLHKTGLDQNAALSAEMDKLLRAQGLTRGTVGERMTALGASKKFLFPATDEGRAQLLAYLNGRITAMRGKLDTAFGPRPKAEVVIKRVPVDIEAGAPQGYEEDGSLDGSRPATYYINLKDMGNWPRFSLPTLTFHETLPGHVLQGAYSGRLPLIRSLLQFNAYVEGWALYSEQLGDELGLYADDPFGRLGFLQSMQFRACRLIVDTGLHAKRWTRDQAIQYFRAQTGSPEDAMRSEVDRYCVTPAQALGYKVGHNEINRLRAKAKAALGARFDLRGFDDLCVSPGAAPLTVLDGLVDAWIANGGVAT
ncbi:MAG TPA: DUF885 family protein [Caulobacteraceae bacterium]|jgi:uncharacterized protein (DUF885 family)|nr:DUF885 family protein [Caulobacteraceae bacterium]